MRSFTTAAVLLSSLLYTPSAFSALLTFDDIPGGSLQNQYGDMPTYKGFNFNATLDWVDVNGSPDWNFGAHSGDFAILNNFAGVGIIVAADASDFTFDGLWAKTWATPPESGGANTLTGTLQGYNNGNLVWSINTGLNGSYKFFGPQAGAIDELRLGFGDIFLVDDISLNAATAAVPEPASLAIWGLGALGCAVAGHRRRKAA